MAWPALEARQLTVSLGGREVVREVSLSAEHGVVTAILGPNGAGKTTLVKALCGLLEYNGEVRVDGDDLAVLSRLERARRVAYVPQRSALDAPLRVDTVVGHGRYAHARSAGFSAADREAVAVALDATDVAELAERSYLELSGGEQRRVLIARALATGARIIVLDEPGASLDIGHALALYELLGRLAAGGCAIITVLHDLNDALAHTERAALFDHGRCVCAGTTAEVLSEQRIRDTYGVAPERGERLCFRLPASSS